MTTKVYVLRVSPLASHQYCHRHHHHHHQRRDEPYTFEASKWMDGVGASMVYSTNTSHTHTICHNLLTPILTYHLVAKSLEVAVLRAFLAAMENIK